MNKVYPISQLICDLKDGYTLSSSEITDLRARVTVSIFSGQVSVYNCGGLIVDPQPTSITWDASGNPAYISSDEINKRLSYCRFDSEGLRNLKNLLKRFLVQVN